MRPHLAQVGAPRAALGLVIAAILPTLGCEAPFETHSPEAVTPAAATHGTAPLPVIQPQDPPDLVLVLIEGLRADLSGAPGAEAALFAPFADDISHRWAAAYAQTPTPYLSVGTVLTGRYPSAIPLCGVPEGSEEPPWCHDLPADLPTLASVLGLYGYRTALWYGGLDQAESMTVGFDHSVDLTTGSDAWASPWDELGLQVEAWWHADSHKPRLLVMVLPDLVVQHRPDMRTAMGLPAEPGPGERRKGMAALGGHQPGRHNKPQRLDTQSLLEGLCVPSRSDAGTKAEGKRPPPHRPPIERKRSPWDAIERVRILAAYAEAAGELGADISGLLASLEGGADRQRITVLTGSNGVSLGELTGSGAYPGAFAWHELLLERTLHVPLAIASSTGGEAAVYDEPVELVDILPTLLGVAGAVTPAGIAGEDLLASSIGEDPPSAYAEFGDMLAVRQGPLMLTLRARLHNSTSLDPVLTEKLLCPGQEGARLHDVVADPMQEHDLRRERSEDAERLEQRMVAYRTGLGAPPADRVDIDSLWQLRLTPAEGYW